MFISLRLQAEELRLTIEGLEKERDFYFGKLRDIEVQPEPRAKAGPGARTHPAAVAGGAMQVLCQEYDTAEGKPEVVTRIFDILYALEVGRLAQPLGPSSPVPFGFAGFGFFLGPCLPLAAMPRASRKALSFPRTRPMPPRRPTRPMSIKRGGGGQTAVLRQDEERREKGREAGATRALRLGPWVCLSPSLPSLQRKGERDENQSKGNREPWTPDFLYCSPSNPKAVAPSCG
jgi:hypothetical protein